MKRLVAFVALAAITIASAGTAAAGGNSPNAKKCQKGGWRTAVMGADGTIFVSEQQCVSFAARGGTLVPLQRPPVANDDSYTTDEDTPLDVPVGAGLLTNDTDPDGDTLTVLFTTDHTLFTENLVLEGDGDGSFVYTPAPNFYGTDSFTYAVSDGHGGTDSATVTITVNPVADPPVARDDSYTTNEDTPLIVDAPGLFANDTDPDGDTLETSTYSSPLGGSLTMNGDGSFVYTPYPNFNGIDEFIYLVSDGHNGSDAGTVTITVNSVNDAPVANNDRYTTNVNTPLNINAPGLFTNDTDADGDTLKGIAVIRDFGFPGELDTSAADGSFVYTPQTDFIGTVQFIYQNFDDHVGSNWATVTITVN